MEMGEMFWLMLKLFRDVEQRAVLSRIYRGDVM